MFGREHEVHMAIAGATIELVGSKTSSHELLKQVQLFIRTSGRHEAADRIGTVFAFDFGQPVYEQVHRFQPRLLHQLTLFADERLC